MYKEHDNMTVVQFPTTWHRFFFFGFFKKILCLSHHASRSHPPIYPQIKQDNFKRKKGKKIKKEEGGKSHGSCSMAQSGSHSKPLIYTFLNPSYFKLFGPIQCAIHFFPTSFSPSTHPLPSMRPIYSGNLIFFPYLGGSMYVSLGVLFAT